MIKEILHILFFSLFFFYSLFVVSQNIIIKPYLQDLETKSVYIMWETDGSGQGFVDWGFSPFELNNTITSSSVLGSGSSLIHTAMIGSLNANSKYYYKVRTSTGVISTLYNFKTLAKQNDEQSIRLVAMSDMQRDGSHPNVFEDIIEKGVIPIVQSQGGDLTDNIDGLLIPGDLVPTGGSYFQWKDYFFNPSDSLTPYTPIYPVLGNHEYINNGKPNFLKYFNLPENGTAANLEEWWYKDISNTRIVGLNSNSGGDDQDTQLVWLQTVLDDACNDINIDFVFAQLHHPFKSELWTPGENGFTGEVIALLEDFSTVCNKPSIHFFGHTHAYSRGQSRDHKHLWINVATAGGAIDNWGEFPNNDYEEFTKSQDEYGFVVLDVDAGSSPKFTLKRYSRGDQDMELDNVLRDELTIKRFELSPSKPVGLFPFEEQVNPFCFDLKATPFNDPTNDSHQATHWQIASDDTNFENTLVFESWKQSENWYNEVNTQASDNLTDEMVSAGLTSNQDYFWRVRYRDEHLTWSVWSDLIPFSTLDVTSNAITGNLVLDSGGESGITNWTGDIEALVSDECNSVPAYANTHLFAVGGICENEMAYGMATQTISVSAFSTEIDGGDINAQLSAFMRNWSGTDVPSIKAEFLANDGSVLATTNTLSTTSNSWSQLTEATDIPIGTRSIKVILEGTRNGGTDNDSYFDEIYLSLTEGDVTCSVYVDCPQTKTLDNVLTNGTQFVKTADSIFSTAQLLGTSNVSYRAGSVISLEAGFTTGLGTNLEVVIEDCVEE